MGIWSEAFIRACPPRPRITGSEWADTYGIIPPPAAEAGPWRTSRTPYLKEVMDTATNRETREVVFIAGSQVGKTASLLQICGFYMANDPTSIMVLSPTIDEAETFSKTRLDPTIKATKVLNAVIEHSEETDTKNKRAKSTMLLKTFIGGFISMVGSNSPSGLASRAIKVLLADEVDRYAVTAGREGSPLELAKQRTATFHDKKILYVSTPTIKGHSLIDDLFQESDQRYFHIPCQHCGTYQKLVWSQVRWDKNKENISDHNTCRYECIECGEHMRGTGRPVMSLFSNGKWIAEAESEKAGFHVNSLYSPFWELKDLVKKYLDAVHSRDKNKIMQFKNLQLGEAFEEYEQTDDCEHVYTKRREFYNCDIPKDVLVLTCGVDTQDNRLEAELVGWGHGFESWGIQYKTFLGDPLQPEVWAELDNWLLETRKREDGLLMDIKAVGIDTGGHAFTEVLTFCKARESRRVFAFKGSNKFEAPLVPLRPSRVGRMNANLFMIGVSDGKGQIYSDLKIEQQGNRYCHFPREEEKGYSMEYFEGLFSEKKVYKNVNGVSKPEWKQIRKRNEPLDVRNYAHAAVRIIQPNFEDIEENIHRVYKMSEPKPITQRKKSPYLSRGVDV